MNITAKELSGEHIGKKFTIEGTPGIRTILGYAKYTSRIELQCTHPTGREVALILLPNTLITIQEWR